ncbi:glycosyl hydrolase family 28 protein [Paenibacillus segetis]|uniref:Glycosyl hydrolases family 28 n=1 Tax=Paenibacillus segetis TaxID=1325360 RepID=A0ABQ1YLR3_9BACL|nr:glycosyl hydrolase family 28 protein [Paenibacillus segetis]GGH28793.1 hypothetical protein GCM10008013_31010 [Paenibacillus segetis]
MTQSKLLLQRSVVVLLFSLSFLFMFNQSTPFGYAQEPEGAVVTAYPTPSDLPAKYKSSDFSITAGNTSVPVYVSGENAWGKKVSYATFDTTASTNVKITVNFPFDSFKLLPDSLGLAGTKNGNSVSFQISPSTDVTLLLDGDYNGRVLHLFSRAPETDMPSAQDSNVIYYPPGYHDLSAQGPVQITSGKTVYVSGGAIVRGRFLVQDAENVVIRGRGILLNDYTSGDGYDEVALALKRSKNIEIRDLIIARDKNAWTAFMWKCEEVKVLNYKAINARYASSDGFNIANSHDVLFDHVFIHTSDDSVAIKGTGDAGYNPAANPATAPPTYNITYQNSQLWSDSNNAIGIGAETLASSFDNITFKNIDILRNYDDLNYPDQLVERSAINICALNATTIQNITFEDIRVEKAKRLINITMEDDFWFGSLQGNWQWPGVIRNIHYKNIQSSSDGSNEIRIYGRDASHLIDNVTFENVQIGNEYVSTFNDSHFKVNAFARNLHLISPTYPDGLTADGPILPVGSIHNAAQQFSQEQGVNQWFYRTWQAGVGTRDMVWNPDNSEHWRGPKDWDAIWKSNGELFFHPDVTQILLDWVSPRAGQVDISGIVKKAVIDGGDGVTVSIWKNNQMIWPSNGQWQVIEYNDSQGYDTSCSTSLQKGDVISFRVDKRGTTSYDSTTWTPEITFVD